MGWLKAESEDSLGEWELAGGEEDRRREGSEGNLFRQMHHETLSVV